MYTGSIIDLKEHAMMFRPITAADQAAYLHMAHSFYQSDAVDHPIPDSYIENTF